MGKCSMFFCFKRVSVKVKVYQVNIQQRSTYFSSLICSATIYVKPRSSFGLRGLSDPSAATRDLRPYFLRKYSIVVSRNSVLKSVALIKIEAISMNPKNVLPLSYKIVNEVNHYFVIDSTQGFIYPRDDFGLDVKTYSIQVCIFSEINFNKNFIIVFKQKVQATDMTDNYFSQTYVTISVVPNKDTKVTCNSNYLAVQLNPDGESVS